MNKIPYTAKDKFGKIRTNHIEAFTNEEALIDLKSEGFTDVTFHNHTDGHIQDDSLDGMSKRQLGIIAKLSLKNTAKVTLIDLLIGNFKTNILYYSIGVTIILFGLFQHRNMTVFFGLIGITVLPLLSVWRYRHIKTYEESLKYYVHGNWDKTLKNIAQLRKVKNLKNLEIDLDFREAYIFAKKDDVNKALNIVDKWQESLNDESLGLFEARLSDIYYCSSNYENYLRLLNKSYTKSSESQLFSIDLAIAEARFGNTDNAIKYVEALRLEELPDFTLYYPGWILGIVAKRNNSSESVKLLQSVLTKLINTEGNTLTQILIAICSCEYAVVLDRYTNKKDEALLLINKFWDILNAHGYEPLIQEASEIKKSE